MGEEMWTFNVEKRNEEGKDADNKCQSFKERHVILHRRTHQLECWWPMAMIQRRVHLTKQPCVEVVSATKVQYQIIEKDRVICELQTQNRGSRKLSGLMKHPATSASCRRHLDKSATLTYT